MSHTITRTAEEKLQLQCHKCGSVPSQPKRDCPANKVKRHASGRKGHVSRVCEAKGEEEDTVFLDSITADGDPWMVNIDISNSNVMFKIDTAPDVTVLPHAVFKKRYEDSPPMLFKATEPLLHLGGVHLMLWVSPG